MTEVKRSRLRSNLSTRVVGVVAVVVAAAVVAEAASGRIGRPRQPTNFGPCPERVAVTSQSGNPRRPRISAVGDVAAAAVGAETAIPRSRSCPSSSA